MSKLLGHRKITGTLTCLTGLRIGGSKESIDIGGTDNPILRHPVTGIPYVPGSSLKGKIRSLLEQKYRPGVMQNGKPCDCGDCDVCVIFGCSVARNTKTTTRGVFRDAMPLQESLDILEQARAESGVFYSETKTEVIIDRKTGKAAGSGPRVQERIPEGTKFGFEISLRVFEEDEVQKHIKFLEEGIRMLENDALGGSGSRGYGKVRIENLKVSELVTGQPS